MEVNPAWYIFYTYPRAEKKAYELLLSKGFEVYLPLKEQIRYWKNRQKKLISEPFFPNYIFVRTLHSKIYSILQNPKIVRCITCGSVPSTLSSEEINLMKKLLESENNLELETDISSGEYVKIIHGPFSGFEGNLFKRKGSHRFAIQINNIPYNLSIEVCVDCVKHLTSA